MDFEADNLGDLELAALDHIWREGSSDVKSVHEAVGGERGITYNTVQSALKRLWEKGLLEREKESYAYVYSARVERREVAERRLTGMMDELIGGELDPALEAFVDLAERAGDEKLDELEQLIAKRRSRDGDD